MGKVKIPYYIVKAGRGYWNPNKPEMRAAGFRSVPCGPDGPEAWRIASEWAARWRAHRTGAAVPNARVWPRGSFGEAFDRFRATETWQGKATKTREEWERMWRVYIARAIVKCW